MVLESFLPSVSIPPVSFSDFIFKFLEENRKKVAYIEASTGEELTNENVIEKSKKFANVLTKRGLVKQDVVAICVTNTIYYPVMILAISSCNAITSPCNPYYTYSELVKQFSLSRPKFIITNKEQMAKMKKVAQKVNSIQKIFVFGDEGSEDDVIFLIDQEEDEYSSTPVDVDVHNDVVLLPFSSGTTGLPKGVMLTHYNFVAIQSIFRFGPLPEGAVQCHVLPFFHAYGLIYMFIVLGQIPMVVMNRFKVNEFCEVVQKYKVTSFGGVPAALAQLCKNEATKNFDLSSLNTIGCGAAALSKDVAIKTEEKFGAKVNQGWGLTEVIVITTSIFPNCPIDSVGLVIPNTRVKVVNPETDEELTANQPGEILVKGPHVMKGYYKNYDQTKKAFDADGWFRTGDIGYYTDQGFVFLMDRMKELIKYKGFQVPPAELEGILVGHPEVLDAGVIGVADEESGEVPRAYVVRRNSKVTSQQLDDYVNERVVNYKRLRGGIFFMDQIPRNPTGKILRRELKKISKSKL